MAIFDRLIEQGVDVNVKGLSGMTALHFAAIKGNAYMVQRLLEKGAHNVSERYFNKPIHLAVYNNRAHVLHHFAHDVNERIKTSMKSSLMIAVKHRYLECVESLLRLGADINMSVRSGYNVLIAFCKSCFCSDSDETIARLLLEHGAEQDVLYEGKSPIDYLIYNGAKPNVIQIMLKMGSKSEKCPDRHLTRRAELLALVE
jgi:ankyrin repeat protein